jgi:putative ABC transport system ATP-binding protein
MSTEAAITIHKLSKSYQESGTRHEIFRDLNLQVTSGEFIVLLGRSGSGKSTFLNLVSGIDQPDSGEVVINGIQLTGLSEHDRTLFRRHHIGFVFQAYNLIPTLTVAENLLLPLELIKRISQEDRDKVSGLLAQLELADRVDAYPDRLSGGEQQRVAIARALIHDPEVILADEPTGNLDLETGQYVLELFDTLVKKSGKTLIMATHSHEVIGKADRIFSIRNQSLVIARDGVYAESLSGTDTAIQD